MPYIFAAESCHKKKLYSRLSSRKPYFSIRKLVTLRFFAICKWNGGIRTVLNIFIFFQLQTQVLRVHNCGSCSWLLCCFVDLHINCVVCVCCRRRWNSLSVETRLEQSATCILSSQTLVDTWHIVICVPAEISRDTALKQRTIFAMWPSDSLWDRCLLISKFRPAFCSCFVAKSYDRRRRLAACDADLPAAHQDHCQCLYVWTIV